MWDYFLAPFRRSRYRKSLATVVIVAAFLALLAAFSLIGTGIIERAYPASGRFVPVTGGMLHVVERNPPGGVVADRPVVVLIHGAAANLHDQENALGERLSQRHRVLLIDRPGHGWSPPGSGPDATSPRGEAALLHEALQRLGVTSFVLAGHSWGGTLAAAYAIDYPQDLAGLILLAPVAYPWTGSISWYYDLGATPVIGPAFAHIFALPVGLLLTPMAVQLVFAPNAPPPDYVTRAAAMLALRPREFLANAREVAGLKAFVAGQAERYRNLVTPTVIIAGTADMVVPPRIHAQPLAAALPHARLVMLTGVGHMPHYAARDRVAEAVSEFAEGLAKSNAAPK
jgi:pimeloyl-ACP methyl ester carboxylesterase